MLKNYLKIAWRNLIKNKVFTLAIIIGLSSAFAVAILLVMTALFELSFDSFHENKASVYQLYLSNQTPRGTEIGTSNPVPLAPALMWTLHFLKSSPFRRYWEIPRALCPIKTVCPFRKNRPRKFLAARTMSSVKHSP